MIAVEVEGVTKRFDGRVAVNDLSLAVPQGSIYGFIGPNGSGKTTTLRMIMGIIYPDQGAIQVLGREADQTRDGRIGYLPEERGLYRKMKVREALRFFGEIKSGGRVDGEVDYWLERFDLADWAERKVETLSKGMSQKVQFIAAVAARPELVVLDEPFSGLDPVNAEALRAAVLELRERGTTVIFSTHEMRVAEELCDYILMIFRGRKVLDGTLDGIQNQYGRDTLRIRCENGAVSLRDLPGVESVSDLGKMRELRLSKECDPQDVLKEIVAHAHVTCFEIARPSLRDISVRIAGPEVKEEVEHA
jgi:ABC-2 type transport system ATP-binding protein